MPKHLPYLAGKATFFAWDKNAKRYVRSDHAGHEDAGNPNPKGVAA
jgi:hypothetical protein